MENDPIELAARRPGTVLRRLRAENSWTLAEISQRTGLNMSTLSKLETGKMSFSYDKMMRIATGLNIDIGVLFAAPDHVVEPVSEMPVASGRRSVTRAGDGRLIENDSTVQHYPAADLLNKQLVPIIIEVKARSRAEYGKLLRHPGEEYLYVLEGIIELHSEFYAPVRLWAGDSIYFDSDMAHAYVAGADGVCKMLSICSTADWGRNSTENRHSGSEHDMPRLHVVRQR
jgi:transcriptional regulator with XRE-family HTH domain